MTEPTDYFANHAVKLSFPWSLYHAPIVKALRRAVDASPGPSILNLGSGPFLELPALRRPEKRFTLCDIDARAVDLARRLHGPSIARTDVVRPGDPLPYEDASFDALVSMDVVEHVVSPLPWLEEAMRVVKPGGRVFFTTPNYASPSLRLIEGTVLELVARTQGWSRRQLHPTKLDSSRFADLLRRAGATGVVVERLSHGWVLAATGLKPAG